MKVNDKEGAFCFYQYSYTSKGVTKAQLFEEHGREISLVPRESCLVKTHTLVAIVAPIFLLRKWRQEKASRFIPPMGTETIRL